MKIATRIIYYILLCIIVILIYPIISYLLYKVLYLPEIINSYVHGTIQVYLSGPLLILLGIILRFGLKNISWVLLLS